MRATAFTGGRLAATAWWGRGLIVRGLLGGLGVVAASVAAEVALLPIVAMYFGRVTLVGVGVNLVAVPAMAVAQIAGMALVPLAVVSDRLPAVSDAVGAVAAAGAGALLDSASVVDRLPRLFWRVARPSLALAAAYYVALAISVWMYVSRVHPLWLRRLVVLVVVGTGGWMAFEPWTSWADRGDGRLHVLFIDVGQGDATFIRFPRGDTLLVDAGGSRSTEYDVGDRVVAPVLAHYGVRRLVSGRSGRYSPELHDQPE